MGLERRRIGTMPLDIANAARRRWKAFAMLAIAIAWGQFGGPLPMTNASSAPDTTALPSSRGDFDGDLKTDLFWRNVSTAAVELWLMNGASTASQPSIVLPVGVTPPATNWKVQSIGDFGGDAKADVMWRNQTSGAAVLWTMNGATRAATAALVTEADLMWAVRGAADFDGDGKVDILWRHETLEGLRLWLAGTTSATFPLTPGLDWTFQGLGDMNGDGKADIVWRNALSGRAVGWLMNGTTRTSGAFLPDPPITQNFVGAGDLDGDGKDDLLWRDELSGAIDMWVMNGLSVTSVSNIGTLDSGWNLQRVGDFNADGKSDVAWRNAISGNAVVWLQNGATRIGAGSVGVEADANWQIQGGFNWAFGALTAPGISPASGTSFVGQLTVSLTATPGATIRYTVDGTEPTAVSARYTAPFPLTGPATVKAKAFRQGWTDSQTTTATYSRQAATPVITPASGTYTNQVLVQVSGETGPELRYTIGYGATPLDPTTTSSLYSAPILVERGATVKVRAFYPGWLPSAVVTATYGIQIGAPTLSPPGGSYAWDAQVTVTAPVPGSVLHYTLTGVDPTESDPTICSGCSLRNPATTLKVKAWKTGTTPSPVTSASYTFSGSGRGDALLVAGGLGDDGETEARLQQLGFTVTKRYASPHGGAPTVVREDATSKKIVVISSSVTPGDPSYPRDIGDMFRTVTTPVLLWEAKMYGHENGTSHGDMGMTGPTGNQSFIQGQTHIYIPSGQHPASGGLTAKVSISTTGMTVAWGEVGPGATVIARSVTANPSDPANNKPVIFAYEAGAVMYDGVERAEGRRVGFFGVTPSMTGNAWGLFDAAVNWATTPFPHVMVMIGSAQPPLASDTLIMERLLQLGFPLQIIKVGPMGPPNATAIEAGGYRLVVISSSVNHTLLTNLGYKTMHRPIVTWKREMYSNLAMVGGTNQYGTAPTEAALTVLEPAHPLAAGLSGTYDVLNPLDPPAIDPNDPEDPPPPPPPVTAPFTWARPNNALGPLGHWVLGLVNSPDGSALPAGIFAFDVNERLDGNWPSDPASYAPARRVGFFLSDNTAVKLNDWGWKLFDAAINWAINRDLDSDGDGLTDIEELRYETNPLNADTNDDGIPDGMAIRMGISPTNPDMDGDGVSNTIERHDYKTNPFRRDTDGDGCIDHPSSDLFPLDPLRCQLCASPPCVDPTPGIPPVITLTEPTNAVLISTVP